MKRFLIRRGFKIYPPFWLLIGIMCLAGFFNSQPPTLRALATELVFLQNYRPAMLGYTWSLAVEEHFYFLLAVGFYVLAKRRPAQPFRAIPAVFILVAVGCLAARLHISLLSPFGFWTHQFPTHLRLDGLCFGVLLSYIYYTYPTELMSVVFRFRAALIAAGILLLAPTFYFPIQTTPFIYTYGFSMTYLGSGLILLSALGIKTPNHFVSKGIAYIGSHSYSIYLWHIPVSLWGPSTVQHLFPQYYNWFIYATVYLLGSVIVGVGMANLVERPVLRIRDRLYPSRGASLGSLGAGPNGCQEDRMPKALAEEIRS